MPVKFHISKDGTARQCRAQSPATCRATRTDHKEHYDTQEEAQKAYEKLNESSVFNTLEKIWKEEITQKEVPVDNAKQIDPKVTTELKLIEDNLSSLKSLALLFKTEVRDFKLMKDELKLDRAKEEKAELAQRALSSVVNDLVKSTSLIHELPNDIKSKHFADISVYAGLVVEDMQRYYKNLKIMRLVEKISEPKKRTFQSNKEYTKILKEYNKDMLFLSGVPSKQNHSYRVTIENYLLYIKNTYNKKNL